MTLKLLDDGAEKCQPDERYKSSTLVNKNRSQRVSKKRDAIAYTVNTHEENGTRDNSEAKKDEQDVSDSISKAALVIVALGGDTLAHIVCLVSVKKIPDYPKLVHHTKATAYPDAEEWAKEMEAEFKVNRSNYQTMEEW